MFAGQEQVSDRHAPLAQSLWSLHFLASEQRPQAEPPQSTSVSSLFFERSLQLGMPGPTSARAPSGRELLPVLLPLPILPLLDAPSEAVAPDIDESAISPPQAAVHAAIGPTPLAKTASAVSFHFLERILG
jgi:hypothetical protein